MANSGSYQIKISNTSSTPNEYLQVAWVVNSQSVANNTSNVTFKLNIYSTYGSGAQPYSLDNSSEKTASLKVNGTQRYYEHNDQWDSPALAIDFRNTSASSPRTLGSWTGTINHNNDGTSPAISLEGYLYYGDTATSHSGLPGGHTVTYTIPAGTFTTIARASKPTCPSTSSFGSAIKITTNRAASSFTHTLVFSCNGHSQTVTGVGAEYNFTIPASWAPTNSATHQTLTVTCTTYSGSTNVGTGSCSATISVPASWVPSVTISYSKTNAADNGDILANVTTVNFTATGTAVQYASVSSYSWSGAVSGSGATKSLIPTTSGTITVTVTVTDSRGRTGTATLNLSTTNAAGTIITDKTSMIFGETISSTITKKKASFTNVISYKIGSSKIVTDSDIGTGTSDTKTIPTSSASYLPNATSGTMVIELNTYDGLSLVGTATKNITIAIPSSWAPSIGSVTLANVDAFNNQLIKTKSKIKVTANSVVPSSGATITSVRIETQDLNVLVLSPPYEATSEAFTKFGSFTAKVTVTDSRGLRAELTSESYTVIDYEIPLFSMTGHRCTSTGEANDFGEYIQVYLTGSWADSVTGNTWSARVLLREYGSSSDPTLAWSITNQNGNLSVETTPIAASVDYAYEVYAVVEDATGGVSETQVLTISTGSVLMDMYKDKLITYGRPASAELVNDLGVTKMASVHAEPVWFENAIYGRNQLKNSKPIYILPEVLKNADLGGASTTSEYYQKLIKWICEKYPDVEHGVWKGIASPSYVDDISIHIYDTSVVDTNGAPQYASVLVTRYNGETLAYGYSNYVWYERRFGVDAVTLDTTVLASQTSAPVNVPSPGVNVGGQLFPAYSKGWMVTSGGGDASIYATDVNGFVYTAYRNNGTWQDGCRHSKINSATSTTSFKDAAGTSSTQTAAGVADIVHASYSTYANKFSVVTSGAVWGVLCMGANATYHSMFIFTYNEAKVWKCDYRNGTYIFCSIDTGAF